METREIERYVRQLTSVSYVDTGNGKHFTPVMGNPLATPTKVA